MPADRPAWQTEGVISLARSGEQWRLAHSTVFRDGTFRTIDVTPATSSREASAALGVDESRILPFLGVIR